MVCPVPRPMVGWVHRPIGIRISEVDLPAGRGWPAPDEAIPPGEHSRSPISGISGHFETGITGSPLDSYVEGL